MEEKTTKTTARGNVVTRLLKDDKSYGNDKYLFAIPIAGRITILSESYSCDYTAFICHGNELWLYHLISTYIRLSRWVVH